jgi:hypothetical protein
MQNNGFVIAQSRKATQYFTSRSSYDRPQWIALDEATIYHTETAATQAASKLIRAGSYNAVAIPLSEIIQVLSTPDDAEEPTSTEQTGSDINVTDGPHDSEMTADDTEDVCDDCDHVPCTCPDEDDTMTVDGQEVVLKLESVEHSEHIKPDALAQGRVAAMSSQTGEVAGKNPYQQGTQEHDDWNKGYKMGKIEQQANMVETTQSVAYKRGYDKGSKLPASVDDNPYEIGTPDGDDWERGFDAAADKVKKSGTVNEAGIPTTVTVMKSPDPAMVDDADKDAGTDVADHHEAKIKVPASVLKALKDLAAEHKHDHDNQSHTEPLQKVSIHDAVQQLIDDLELGTVEGLKMAQVHLTSYMSVITNKIPPVAMKFITSGGNKISLKDLYNEKWDRARSF